MAVGMWRVCRLAGPEAVLFAWSYPRRQRQTNEFPHPLVRTVVSRVAGVLSWGLLGYSLFALSVAWSCARNDSRLPSAWGALANGQGPWVGYFTGVFLLEHIYMMLFWSVVLAHLAFFAERCRRSFLLLTVSFATGFSVVASHNWLITGLDRR